jgi:hypothetical protein
MPATDIARHALSGLVLGSARLRAAGARLIERARGTDLIADHGPFGAADAAGVTELLASVPTPPMPRDLLARVDRALGAEIARAKAGRLPVPAARPSEDQWQNWGLEVPAPRAPLAIS